VRAMRRGRAHPSLTRFRLCKEFHKLPSEIEKESAKTIEEFVIILNEMDRQTEEEVEKAKRGARHVG